MKYSHDFGEATVFGEVGSQYRIPRRVKRDQVGLDMVLGAVLLLMCVVFFVFWFESRLSRSSKGDLGENRP